MARDGPRRSMVDALLDEHGEDPRFGTVVVYGPPGFGKTTLAQEVCHDPCVLDAFTGGVLWATLGEQGRGVLPGLTAAVSALTGASAAFNSLEEAAARLADLLESRDCLLVLDDVWDRAHLQPFLGSEHVARLVTTRSLEWLGAEGNARVVALEQMDPAEAVQVLLNHVPPDASREADPAALRPALGELADGWGSGPASRDLRRCAPVGDRLPRPFGLGRTRLARKDSTRSASPPSTCAVPRTATRLWPGASTSACGPSPRRSGCGCSS